MGEDFFSAGEKATLMQITLEELGEIAEQLAPLLNTLDRDPSDAAAREEAMLAFHTVGGSAGLAGLKDISAAGVGMETLLRRAAPGEPLPADVISQLRAALGTINDFLKANGCG